MSLGLELIFGFGSGANPKLIRNVTELCHFCVILGLANLNLGRHRDLTQGVL